MSLNDTTHETSAHLCECGCGQPTNLIPETSKALGHVKGQPFRFVHGHNRRRSTVIRFWEKVDKSATNECWEWTGYRLPSGHGQIGINGRMTLVHRYSYELHNGPIPKNMHCCHSCDNPACVNPAHLWLGTNADNMSDKVNKGRQSHTKAKTKLTEAQVREIRNRYAQGGISQTALAIEYGVGSSNVSRIISHKHWRDTP